MPLNVKDLVIGAGANRLEGITRDLISLVETKIREADRSFGRNVISIDLPTEFNIPGMSVKDQQLFVYSKLIHHLRDGGFEVGIALNQASTTLHVSFTISFTDTEVEAMYSTIHDHMLKNDSEVRAFASRDSSAISRGKK